MGISPQPDRSTLSRVEFGPFLDNPGKGISASKGVHPISISSAIPTYPSVVAGILAGALILAALYGLLAYVVIAVTFFRLFRKARVKLAWLAFIPIAQLWPFFWTIKKSPWNVLWVLVPSILDIAGLDLYNGFGTVLLVIGSVVPIVFGIIWQIRLFKAFRMNPWWLLIMLGLLIPRFSLLFELAYLVLLAYMAFSRKVQYNPNFDGKGGGPGRPQGPGGLGGSLGSGGNPDDEFFV